MSNNLELVPFALNWENLTPAIFSFRVEIYSMTDGLGRQVGIANLYLKVDKKWKGKITSTLIYPPKVIYFEAGVSVADEDLQKKCEIVAKEIWE